MSDVVELSPVKRALVKRVADDAGFDDCVIETRAGSMKGDGYLGIINTVVISDAKRQLHLVIKSAQQSQHLREQAPVRKAYDREIFMYEQIFPEFRRLQTEKGVRNRFDETAKCYATSFLDEEECLVLENLKELDFALWNRKVRMNADHVEIVFKTYGKFHAVAFALKQLEPEKYVEFSKNLENIFAGKQEENFKEKCEKIFENGFEAVEGNEKATAALAKFAKDAGTFFEVDVKNIEKFTCILHGDCWCNNMMFKYGNLDNPSKPTEVCLLDWQISMTGSPVFDLSYFFYACSSKEVLYDLKKFLRIYHHNFSKTLEEMGLKADEIMSFDDLENEWKKFSRYGLFMTLVVANIMVSDSDEAPDLSELAKDGKDILESITNVKSSNSEEAHEKITDVLLFMAENEYI